MIAYFLQLRLPQAVEAGLKAARYQLRVDLAAAGLGEMRHQARLQMVQQVTLHLFLALPCRGLAAATEAAHHHLEAVVEAAQHPQVLMAAELVTAARELHTAEQHMQAAAERVQVHRQALVDLAAAEMVRLLVQPLLLEPLILVVAVVAAVKTLTPQRAQAVLVSSFFPT